MSDLRVYVPGVDEFDSDGYPLAWRTIKHDVRAAADHRCVRCGHPYAKGGGEWSPCDERCTHLGPVRIWLPELDGWAEGHPDIGPQTYPRHHVEARYRILTVHHLNGDKADCRWFNLAALDQRCHLTIQGKVVMDRTWPHEHSPWFRPYVAGYYASRFLGEEIGRDEAEARVDELLALEVRQLGLEIA